MGTRSMARINVLHGNAKIHGKLLHAQCARNIFLHINTCITAMKFYNGNPSYTLKTEYDTKFYNPESRILDTSTAIYIYLSTLQCVPIPYFDGIVPESRHNLLVIILQAIDSFRIF